MTTSDPTCTCPPTRRPIPHNSACPRFDEDRAWSIQDRAARPRGTVEMTAEMVDQFAPAWLAADSPRAALRAALEAAGFTVVGGDA